MNIKTINENAEIAFKALISLETLKDFERNFLGKKSEIAGLSKQLKNLSPEEKKTMGKAVSDFRKHWETAIKNKRDGLEASALAQKLEKDWLDTTKSTGFTKGSIHPLSRVQRRTEEIFSSMGFMIADGPHVETEWHNFDALNIPDHHPARDMQDTFWIKKDTEESHENYVLRTQTSNVQIRTMLKYGAPVRVVSPGRVFRNEDIDATHDAVFYQCEGLLIDEGISLAHLKGTMTRMLSELFEKEVKIRLRPGYFPFVEPGFEIDMWWEFTDKNGQKQGKWLEFAGAGMVHPNVFKHCGIDSEKYSGFAFGFGLTRLTMMKYQISDIRLLLSQKVDFLGQF
jgi:phenylalanyl-tRNA synthetase alpha chain